MINLTQLLSKNLPLPLIFKAVMLVLLFLYTIYTFLLLTQIKELNTIVYVYAKNASKILFVLSIVYFLITVSLFFAALVIL